MMFKTHETKTQYTRMVYIYIYWIHFWQKWCIDFHYQSGMDPYSPCGNMRSKLCTSASASLHRHPQNHHLTNRAVCKVAVQTVHRCCRMGTEPFLQPAAVHLLEPDRVRCPSFHDATLWLGPFDVVFLIQTLNPCIFPNWLGLVPFRPLWQWHEQSSVFTKCPISSPN